MLSVNNIFLNFGSYAPPKNEAKKESASQGIVEFSKSVSDCISNTQRGLIEVQRPYPKLNGYSFASDYFGVSSADKILNKIDNQMALTILKSRDENIVSFAPLFELNSQPEIKYVNRFMNKLQENKFGRITFMDKTYGKNGENGTHTIGMVYHNGQYIILDSIPEKYPEIKDCHEKLLECLGLDPKDVIFSDKPQQTMDEYTCNNWTHANLDAVFDYLNSDGADKDLTPEVLDKILPEDINKVLGQQLDYTVRGLNGRTVYDLIERR
ncbi:hypothetical protein IJI31_04400 [bacterium]|nr:hypothetical protein [bacterium]